MAMLIFYNIYLFAIRGIALPTSSPIPKTEKPLVAEEAASVQIVPFVSKLGQLGGVAGLRSFQAMTQEVVETSFRKNIDLEESVGLSGLRNVEDWCDKHQGTIKKGDTFSSALLKEGIEQRQLFSLLEAFKGLLDFRTCRAGEKFEFLKAPNGKIQRLEYFKSPLVSYSAERKKDRFQARREEKKADLAQELVSIRIKGSLYASIERSRELPALAMMVVNLFAWDIDFYIDPQPNDEIRLIVEKLSLKDQLVGYGRILAAEYRGGQLGILRAFWYDRGEGQGDYYNEEGNSMRKAFLKSPIKFTRISSEFGMRVHPILGFSKMHHGVDLAAPVGTPVMAAGDGRVVFAGRKGANGNLVLLRHSNGYETAYAHLHTIAKGVTTNARVRQKQLIGTVGSTGRSTGPHLHYGMIKDKRQVNPLSQKFPSADPVPPKELPLFKKAIQPLLQQLEKVPAESDLRTATLSKPTRKTG